MAFYFGNKRKQLRIDGKLYDIQFYSSTIVDVFDGVKLISLDGFTLLDSNNTYLTAQEGVN